MPKSTSPSSSFKQSTLSFSSLKRNASGDNIFKARAPKTAAVDGNLSSDAIETSYNSDDGIESIESDVPSKKDVRPKTSPVKQSTIIKVTRPREKVVERLQLNAKDPKWRRYFKAVATRRGNVSPIHAENQDKFHDALRIFDLSYEYGPCIGVTRLERWERAFAMGLDPPAEVKDILMYQQAATDPSYSHSVFHDHQM